MAIHTYRIVGFLDDTFLQKSTAFLTIGHGRDQGAGVIDSLMTDYFNTPTSIADRRGGRSIVLSSAAPSYSKMTLWFDNHKVLPQDMWLKISANNYTRLFSIIELCELMQNASVGYLNTLLQTDELYKDAYVKDTLLMGTKRLQVSVALDSTQKITVPEWFQFRVKISQEDDIFDLMFKIYVGRTAFMQGYDITTITKVVPPCNPASFFGNVDWTSDMDAIIKSVAFGSEILNTAIAETDQQGLFAYYTKYVMDPDRSYRVPFQILHRGPKAPTSLECRSAIKDYLLSLGFSSEEGVQARFPELFIDCQYYVIPMWDQYTDRPDRTVYPAATPYLTDIYQIMTAFFTDSQDVFMSKAQLLLNAQNDMFSIVMPHALNAEALTIKELFPTYMSYSTHSIEFEYMDPTDKEFARQLIRAFALLSGTLTAADALITYEDDKKYITFTTGRAEFHVLSKESYMDRR